jgi:hypothetical protein
MVRSCTVDNNVYLGVLALGWSKRCDVMDGLMRAWLAVGEQSGQLVLWP